MIGLLRRLAEADVTAPVSGSDLVDLKRELQATSEQIGQMMGAVHPRFARAEVTIHKYTQMPELPAEGSLGMRLLVAAELDARVPAQDVPSSYAGALAYWQNRASKEAHG